MLPIHFAPIQGYTDDIYRRHHFKLSGGVVSYYTPFVRMESGGIRAKDLRDISPENNTDTPVVPQIIFKNRKEFDVLTEKIESLGYKTIDLNMGCPFPLQANHGRGAGILQHPEIVEDIANEIKARKNIEFSVKLRLGWKEKNEIKEIIPILNDVKLKHITLHPRTGKQQYKGIVDMEMFDHIYKECANPLIYNGNITNVENIDTLENKYPDLAGVMIGRGLLGCPSLAIEYSQRKQWSNRERISFMLELHESLISEYSNILCGDTQLLNKMHCFWEYSETIIDKKAYKKIIKSGNLRNYLSAVAELKFI